MGADQLGYLMFKGLRVLATTGNPCKCLLFYNTKQIREPKSVCISYEYFKFTFEDTLEREV